MKHFERIEIVTDNEVSTECDRCHRVIENRNNMEYEEIFSILKFGGYGSIFGDGSIIRLDLCQNCAKEVLGQWIRVEEEKY